MPAVRRKGFVLSHESKMVEVIRLMIEWSASERLKILTFGFKKWKTFSETPLLDAIKLLSESSVGHRTFAEKKIIRKLLLNPDEPTFEIFHKLTEDELDRLCNELEHRFYLSRSIIFLQGERGKNTFVVVSGSVDLFFEQNKQREASLMYEFSNKRGYAVKDSECERLGKLTRTLYTGTIFGDVAALSNIELPRSATAVAQKDSLVFVVGSQTYMAVLRHYRRKNMHITAAIEMLKDLPVFKDFSYPKITSIAYGLEHETVPRKIKVASMGESVKRLYLISSGTVAAFSGDGTVSNLKVPNVPIATLGRGMIIGEAEVRKHLQTFQMTYVTASDVEMYVMEVSVFKDNAMSNKLRRTKSYQTAEAQAAFRDKIHRQQAAISQSFKESFVRMSRSLAGSSFRSTTGSAKVAVMKESFGKRSKTFASMGSLVDYSASLSRDASPRRETPSSSTRQLERSESQAAVPSPYSSMANVVSFFGPGIGPTDKTDLTDRPPSQPASSPSTTQVLSDIQYFDEPTPSQRLVVDTSEDERNASPSNKQTVQLVGNLSIPTLVSSPSRSVPGTPFQPLPPRPMTTESMVTVSPTRGGIIVPTAPRPRTTESVDLVQPFDDKVAAAGENSIKLLFTERYANDKHSKNRRTLHTRYQLFSMRAWTGGDQSRPHSPEILDLDVRPDDVGVQEGTEVEGEGELGQEARSSNESELIHGKTLKDLLHSLDESTLLPARRSRSPGNKRTKEKTRSKEIDKLQGGSQNRKWNFLSSVSPTPSKKISAPASKSEQFSTILRRCQSPAVTFRIKKPPIKVPVHKGNILFGGTT